MSITLRAVRLEELPQFVVAFGTSLGIDLSREHLERIRQYVAWDRLRVADDQGRIVGTFGVHSLELAVPGGVLPMAGVTMVTVLPTHRRRGILRRWMAEHLREFHQRGESLAGLWASEGSIYGRFGYGMASERTRWKIPTAQATLRCGTKTPLEMELVSHDEAVERLPKIYDEIWRQRPGLLSRSLAWWEHRLLADPHGAMAGGVQRRVVYAPQGEPRGYALYRTRRHDLERLLDLQVIEVMAGDRESEQALWQYLFNVDLVNHLEAGNLPADHPLRWWITDIRKVKRQICDALWLRVVDVQPALAGRRYAAAGELTLDVVDKSCPWNQGRFSLQVSSDGQASCRPTSRTADIVCPAHVLGSAYLGGVRWSDLRRAGEVTATDQAIVLADQMFAGNELPWSVERF